LHFYYTLIKVLHWRLQLSIAHFAVANMLSFFERKEMKLKTTKTSKWQANLGYIMLKNHNLESFNNNV
ncbi:hypothetical protein ACNQ1X_00820, partial [Mycoplasma sp. SK341A]|uniref:hypothetical protein n=1 Tax=Mycoplasma sp. SK341A TaxID=3401679 RepID=UPI003AAC7B85